jgi:hypothetical protein
MDFKVNLKSNENRPTMLIVVCILSWIHIGFNFVISLYQFISGPLSDGQIKDSQVNLRGAIVEMRNSGLHSFADMMEKVSNMTPVLNDNHYFALSLTLIGLIIGFVGVSFMFLGRKLGFHLYIIYSIFSIGQIYLFFTASEIPSLITWWGIIIAGIFIFMYSRSLKWMK